MHITKVVNQKLLISLKKYKHLKMRFALPQRFLNLGRDPNVGRQRFMNGSLTQVELSVI